jgi:hypothetical protein
VNEEAIARVGQQRRRGKNCYNHEQGGSAASSAFACMYIRIYRVSRGECARLQENVP